MNLQIRGQKGSLVMYYLKEMIGEEKVNAALREVLQKHAYQESPYPTSYTLTDALRRQTPPEFQYLFADYSRTSRCLPTVRLK